MIKNLGTDVSEKHFRTKSVSALHPILPVYFNILSPGLGPYSNFETIIIVFEMENIVTTKRCYLVFCSEVRNLFIYSKNRILSKRKNENKKQLKIMIKL